MIVLSAFVYAMACVLQIQARGTSLAPRLLTSAGEKPIIELTFNKISGLERVAVTVRVSPGESIEETIFDTFAKYGFIPKDEWYLSDIDPTATKIKEIRGLETKEIQLVDLSGKHTPFVLPQESRKHPIGESYDIVDSKTEGLYQPQNADSVVELDFMTKDYESWEAVPPQGFGFYLKPKA